MQIEYTGRQVVVTEALRRLGDEGMARISKILGKAVSAHVVLAAEKYRQSAEVTIKTRLQSIVALCESTSMETALREAMAKAEGQAIKYKEKFRTAKRKPKQEKNPEEGELARTRIPRQSVPQVPEESRAGNGNGNGHTAKPVLPVTVHSYPAKTPIAEPHVVRSLDSVALRPMTLEEAVKEAEFRDREVFVFRDNQGNLKVLHRKRDGKMELIEAPA